MSSPHIDNYQFGKIVINGSVYTKDVIILPSRIISGWWRTEGHKLHISDLDEVLHAKPQILVVGQGANSRMHVTAEVEEKLREAKIEMICLPTDEACLEYNRRSITQLVAAALHLTC
jgi:hypothetical protein